MGLSRPRAVLFDWDNTLVDSFGVIHVAINETLEAMGHAPWTFDETCRHVGKSMRDSFPRLFGERWEEARDVFYRSYASHHLDHVEPLAGAAELLDDLAGAQIYLAVVSNKTGAFLRDEVAHLGWRDYFAQVVGALDAAEDKPAPAAVALALEGSGIAPGADVWLVGDNAIDLDCAEASGCLPLIVRGAVATGDEALLARARWRFDSRAELAALVRQF